MKSPLDATSPPTNRHYDNDVAFFRAFLDPYMKYTSGLYCADDDTLDVAVVQMLDLLIAAGGVRPGARVLEIGSGWGALVRRLDEVVPDVGYVGLSPSEIQNDFIRRSVDARARVLTTTFEAWQPDDGARFDAVFLVGAFCHLADKRLALERLAELLAPGGRIVIEDTFFLSEALFRAHKDHAATLYVQREIFGFAEICSLGAHMDLARASGLKVTTLLEHSDSYARTIATWIERLARLDPERFPLARPYMKYMSIAQKGWNKTTGNFLLTMQRL